ncbi:uncharacterized protein [Dermacentor albipictus]|uniref:uncharacterized protein isoform X2 n=1 Tax=Dermacentor albipictus TaxID=60249 RepID=UPI0031FC50A1
MLSGPHLTKEDVCEIHWRRSSRHAPRRQLGSRRLRCHIQVVQSTLSLRASCFVLALAKKIASPEKEHFSAAASWTCRVDTQGISGSCIVCHLVIVPSETALKGTRLFTGPLASRSGHRSLSAVIKRNSFRRFATAWLKLWSCALVLLEKFLHAKTLFPVYSRLRPKTE